MIKSIICNFGLFVNDQKIFDATFKLGPKFENEKEYNFFNLPTEIIDDYLVKYGKLFDKKTYVLNYDLESSKDKRQIEEIISNHYFNLEKISMGRVEHEALFQLGRECFRELKSKLIEAGILDDKRQLLMFDWSNDITKRKCADILGTVVRTYSQLRELKRKLIKKDIYCKLQENRNNPYFNN